MRIRGRAKPTSPYGGMSTTGASTTNSTTYTGRESDGDGLLFYRARYYSPSTGRFISQDPTGFAGGSLNLYRYAAGSPSMLRDPSGKCPMCIGAGIGAAVGFGGYALTHRKDFLWDCAAEWALGGALLGSGLGEFLGEEGTLAATEDTTTLYRVVGPDELSTLEGGGGYSPSPGGLESKYFYPTAEQGSNFASNPANTQFGPFTLPTTEVPTSLINPVDTINVSGEGTVVTILNSMPLRR